jgi:pseudouridine 5'-phosphatase
VLLRRKPSHVIFDLDGVLLDTEPLYTRATQQIVGEYGKVFDWSVKGGMIGRGPLDGARYLVDALELPLEPEEYLARCNPLLAVLFPSVGEIPGAREFVLSLAARGVPMAVATSAEAALTRLKLQRHAWFDAFGAIVSGDDPRIRRAKPAPDIFLVAAAELGAEPEACLVFEDSPAGVEAALAAGMQVIALPDPALDTSRFAGAERVVRSFSVLSPSDLGL